MKWQNLVRMHMPDHSQSYIYAKRGMVEIFKEKKRSEVWPHWQPPANKALSHQNRIDHTGAAFHYYLLWLQQITLDPQSPAAVKQLSKVAVRYSTQQRVLKKYLGAARRPVESELATFNATTLSSEVSLGVLGTKGCSRRCNRAQQS